MHQWRAKQERNWKERKYKVREIKMGQGWRGRATGNSDCRTELINKIWPFILDFSSLVEIKQVVRRKTILTRRKKFKQRHRRLCHIETKHQEQKATAIKSAVTKEICTTEATLPDKKPRDCRNNYKWVRKHILCDHQLLNPMPIVKMNWQMTPRIQYLIQANKENPPKGCIDSKVTVRSE